MKVKIKYVGYSPQLRTPYMYRILTETGIADEIYESVFTSAEEVDMPEELWSEGSGWATVVCSNCGTDYRERCRPGSVLACPVCGEPYLIPDDIKLEASNMMEEVDG